MRIKQESERIPVFCFQKIEGFSLFTHFFHRNFIDFGIRRIYNVRIMQKRNN